jgi:hypothetical protein
MGNSLQDYENNEDLTLEPLARLCYSLRVLLYIKIVEFYFGAEG